MKNKTWMVIGLALVTSSVGCKTTSMSKLPGLGWLGPNDAEAVVAADSLPSTELPPPSSAAIPKLPIKQAAASQAPGQPDATAKAAVNTEPLKTYPATPYPNFQTQTKAPTPQNYTTGPYSTVATPVPSQNVRTLNTTASQPQAQQGFYDPNYDASTRRPQQQPAETHTPDYSVPPYTGASTGFHQSAPRQQTLANPHFSPQSASPNMPVTYAAPAQSQVGQLQRAAPIPSTAPTGTDVAPANYMTPTHTAAAAHVESMDTAPSYYGNTQQQRLSGPWRPGSTSSCQDGACITSMGSEMACQGGTCAPSQAAVPQVDQPYQSPTNTDALATPLSNSDRDSLWR